jgi:2'-5' RNA ligase
VADEDVVPHQPGQTALLAVVPAAEPLVGPWRRRFDAAAAAGVPAHVTIVAPFLPVGQLGRPVIAALEEVIAEHRSFAVRFAECRRFPDVLYLAPAPSEPFRVLTASIAARWPEAPPYGGQFADIVPHLTVAHGQQPDVLARVKTALTAGLPVDATICAVSLFVSDGVHWSPHGEFPLA